uniref:GATA-type domain-containing protein n=1 Tax=Ananas comosus var. bracteatus TaxID=296719 RepID=A0A6V7QSS7_ANACO
MRSSDLILRSLLPTNEYKNGCMEKSSPDRYERKEDVHCSLEWTSLKMQWTRKMMGSDQLVERKLRRRKQDLQCQEQETKDNSNGIIRVCSNCNTTRTPLWRSGPQGPKSLCNACGIRQRKARQAMALAAAGGAVISAEKPIEMERNEDCRILPYKKRCRITPTAKKKVKFEDVIISLNNNSAFHRVFLQDEKDAAILLMGLSCGLIQN